MRRLFRWQQHNVGVMVANGRHDGFTGLSEVKPPLRPLASTAPRGIRDFKIVDYGIGADTYHRVGSESPVNPS